MIDLSLSRSVGLENPLAHTMADSFPFHQCLDAVLTGETEERTALNAKAGASNSSLARTAIPPQ